MGNETILYYVFEEKNTGLKRSVKMPFWRKIKPLTFVVEEDDFSVVTVMIPRPDKVWKKEKLIKTMQEGSKEYPDYLSFADVVIEPSLQQILMQTQDFAPIFWKLFYKLFNDNFIPKKQTQEKVSINDSIYGNRRQAPESIVLLLGNSFFPEEQIQKFIEMVQPCFPYVNQLTIVYESDYEMGDKSDDVSSDNASDNEVNIEAVKGWNRLEEAIDELLEMLYYEYGLVGQIWDKDGLKPQPPGIRNGQCPILFLDYGYQGNLPYSMMRNGGIYIDALSSYEKERRIIKKCSKISYLSPLKYLDTIVKSGYDKLVNQAKIRT